MKNLLFLPILFLSVATACTQQKSIETTPQGAYYTGQYHNYFSEVLGVSQNEVGERMNQLWEHFFTPGDFSKFAR